MPLGPKARSLLSSAAFVTGLSLATAFALSFDPAPYGVTGASERGAPFSPALPAPVRRILTQQDLRDAERAWRYFVSETVPETGLVNSVAGFPSATFWDQGSYLLALAAAMKLDLISSDDALSRLDRFLTSLERLTLFDGRLPNKVVNTATLEMTNYDGSPAPGGIGWSALDIARLLVGLEVIGRTLPDEARRIDQLIASWDLAALAEDGEIIGTQRGEDGRIVYVQEGRIGYEQYAARAFALFGLDVGHAMLAQDDRAWEAVSGIEIGRDTRRAETHDAITPILSEPYLLMAFELGLDSEARDLSARLYAAQAERSAELGFPVFVSEDHLDQAPYFGYHSVWGNGRPWTVLSEDGHHLDGLDTLSTKAAFGWDVLVGSELSESAVTRVRDAQEDGTPWAAGIYLADRSLNSAASLNTNAVVLEALHYRAFGPLLQY